LLTHKNNRQHWFEIPVSRFPEAVDFYSRIFQRRLSIEQHGNFHLALVPHTKDSGYVGTLLFRSGLQQPVNPALIYISIGSDLDVLLKRIVEHGGRIITPITALHKDLGYFAVFEDPEGNAIGVYSQEVPSSVERSIS